MDLMVYLIKLVHMCFSTKPFVSIILFGLLQIISLVVVVYIR